MANKDKGEKLGDLELVPLDDGKKPAAGRSVFHPNTRAKDGERRKQTDRREGFRLTDPRRTKARRPKGAWDDEKTK